MRCGGLFYYTNLYAIRGDYYPRYNTIYIGLSDILNYEDKVFTFFIFHLLGKLF